MLIMFRFALEASFAMSALIDILAIHESLLSSQKVNGRLPLTLTHFLPQILVVMSEMVLPKECLKW